MKKILLTIAAGLISTSAFANNISTDFFKSNGYTKPTMSIIDIQEKVNNGTYSQYLHIAGKSSGIFAKKLKDGTALPEIRNANRILNALADKKKVILASSKTPCLPVFAEIAKQNGVSCDDLLSHLNNNAKDGENLFSNIQSVLNDINEKVSEMIKSEVSEEISETVKTELELTVEPYLNEIYEQSQGLQNPNNFDLDPNEFTQEINDAVAAIQEIVNSANGPLTSQEIADQLNEIGDYDHEITATDVDQVMFTATANQ